MNIPLSPYAPENLVSQDGFSRPVPRQPAHSPYSGWSWCLLMGFPPISAAASIYLFKPPYAIASVPTLSGHAIACQRRSLPRVRRHRASSPQGSSSNNGCCHFSGHHGVINVRLSFPHPLLVWNGHVESTGGMSGRNPPLCCTLTPIAMQGHQTKTKQKHCINST